jgi:cytochrome P450
MGNLYDDGLAIARQHVTWARVHRVPRRDMAHAFGARHVRTWEDLVALIAAAWIETVYAHQRRRPFLKKHRGNGHSPTIAESPGRTP